jgi:hypothetical protein
MNGRIATLSSVLVVAVVAAPAVAASAAGDDQARLDAAIDGFSERMVEAGWESQGPADDDDDEEEVSSDDEIVAECFADLGFIFEDLDADELPGQIATSESDEFSYAPAGDEASTTDFLSFDITEETASAFAASVDDANVDTLTRYIDILGDKSTGDCLREAFEEEMAAEAQDSDIPVEFDVNVASEGDLGIGEHSAALGYELSGEFFVPINLDVDVVLAQVGNDVVGVAHLISGEPESGFDPRAELQSIVDSLDG